MKPSRKAFFWVLAGSLLASFWGYSETRGEASFFPRELQPGWELAESPRIFTKKTLFEHIDGQAELFFKYGFRQCTSAVYRERKNPENQIDADIYDMGNTLQAFGIFSQLRTEGRPGGFGLDSTLEKQSALFYKGKYFVMLYATEENPAVLEQLAKQVSSKITDPSSPPRELNYFPRDGLKPGSIRYFPEGLLGHRFLKGGFQGGYTNGEKDYQLFIAVFRTPQDGQRAFDAFKDYLTQKGKVTPKGTTAFGSNALRGESPYQGQIIVLQKGSYLLGGIGPHIGEKEEKRLAEFVKNVK
jgi:hypothetical protein